MTLTLCSYFRLSSVAVIWFQTGSNNVIIWTFCRSIRSRPNRSRIRIDLHFLSLHKSRLLTGKLIIYRNEINVPREFTTVGARFSAYIELETCVYPPTNNKYVMSSERKRGNVPIPDLAQIRKCRVGFGKLWVVVQVSI